MSDSKKDDVDAAAQRSVDSHCNLALDTIPDWVRPIMEKQFREGAAWQRERDAELCMDLQNKQDKSRDAGGMDYSNAARAIRAQSS